PRLQLGPDGQERCEALRLVRLAGGHRSVLSHRGRHCARLATSFAASLRTLRATLSRPRSSTSGGEIAPSCIGQPPCAAPICGIPVCEAPPSSRAPRRWHNRSRVRFGLRRDPKGGRVITGEVEGERALLLRTRPNRCE